MLLVVGEGRREEGLLRIHSLNETGEALNIQLLCGSVNAYGDSSQHNGPIRKLQGAFYSLANSAILLGGFALPAWEIMNSSRQTVPLHKRIS